MSHEQKDNSRGVLMQDSDATRLPDVPDGPVAAVTEPQEPDSTAESGSSSTSNGQTAERDPAGDGASTTDQGGTRPPPDDVAAPEPPRSPAEAFADLAAQIAHARRDIAQVADFARGTGAQLQRAHDDVFLQGADAALRGLMRIDELIFKQTRERTTSSMHPETAALATMIGQAIEGELRSADVQPIEPEPGDDLDLSRMIAIANKAVPLLRGRRAGTVADVVSRGYLYATPQREQILKKAEVVIWRARDEVPFDSTEDVVQTQEDSDE